MDIFLKINVSLTIILVIVIAFDLLFGITRDLTLEYYSIVGAFLFVLCIVVWVLYGIIKLVWI